MNEYEFEQAIKELYEAELNAEVEESCESDFVANAVERTTRKAGHRLRRKKTPRGMKKSYLSISGRRVFAKKQTNSKIRNILITEDEGWTPSLYRRSFEYAWSVF